MTGLWFACTQPAWAAEWSVEPLFDARGLFNTNRRLTTGPHDNVFGVIAEPGAAFRVRTEQNELTFTPRGRISRYTEEGNLDSDDAFFDLRALHRRERWQWGLDGNVSLDSTLVTELEDTGLVQVNRRVTTLQATPNVTWQVTDKDNLRLRYGYTDVSFEDSTTANLNPYTYQLADATYTRSLSDTDSVFVTAFYTRFDVPDIDSLADSYAAQGGLTHAFGATLRGSASAGVIYTDSDFVVSGVERSSQDTGLLADVSLEKDFEQTSMRGRFARAVFPSSRGAQSTREDLTFNVNRKFLERLDGSLNFLYRVSQSQNQDFVGVTDLDRTYMTAGAQMHYRLTPFWSLAGGYTYSRQEFDSSGDSAFSHAVFLTIHYSGDKISISR